MSDLPATLPVRLNTRVSALPGIGKRRAAALGRMDIHCVSDLVRHLPMRYERVQGESTVSDLTLETIGSVRAMVSNCRWVGSGRKGRFQATLEDHTGRLTLTWFNAGWMRDKLHAGMTIRVQGKVTAFNGYPQMVNPKWERAEDEPGNESPNAAATAEQSRRPASGAGPANPPNADAQGDYLRPIYPATEEMPSGRIELLMRDVLPQALPLIHDPLPAVFVQQHAMPTLAEAFRMAHFPEHEEEHAAARRRLAFNELLLLQLGITLKREHVRQHMAAPALRRSDAIDEHIRSRFPFQLTAAQERVVAEIAADLQQSKPMNRLLQGDVGSGKTIVALYAMLLAVANRKQAALMAPTEILAEQHHLSISGMLEGANVTVTLLTGARGAGGAERRREAEAAIEAGDVDIVVGTQALLTESVRFHDLAVVVVDEQHRFGVLQRAAFRDRGGGGHGREKDEDGLQKTEEQQPQPVATGDHDDAAAQPLGDAAAENHPAPPRQRSPHYLVMTATPIPRTLSLTIFGDLDVSTIDRLPPGRTPVTTRVVEPSQSDDVYSYLAKRLARGEQAYVVLPAIDDAGDDSPQQLRNVQGHVKMLRERYCADYEVAAVHGRLKRDEREDIMQRFRAGEVHVLVATTVIEVGIDVPNATVMIVEHAERFGLAQLHQLRGRVGRGGGNRRSLCVLIAEPTTDDAAQRMTAIAGTTDGFKIAERDLEIRGIGDFFGTRQHGLPPLRVAAIPEDMELLQLAKRDARTIVENDPTLGDDQWSRLRKVLLQQYGDALGLIDVG